jgi:hypothetical protein
MNAATWCAPEYLCPYDSGRGTSIVGIALAATILWLGNRLRRLEAAARHRSQGPGIRTAGMLRCMSWMADIRVPYAQYLCEVGPSTCFDALSDPVDLLFAQVQLWDASAHEEGC